MKKTTLVIALLFAVSGISGLVYELVWIRLLSHLLGGTTLAISTVLAAFMGGLALGSHHFGKRVDQHPSPLRLYAFLELGVAGLGALVPLLVMVLEPAYIGAAAVLPESMLPLLRIGLTFLLLLPPTFLMGGTLPVLSRFLVRHSAQLGRNLGMLYAVNTIGAVIGIALAGFVLIPAIGLPGSTVFAVIGNVIAGLVALVLVRNHNLATDSTAPATKTASTETATAPKITPELSPTFLAGIFALTGFAALGFELYWTRALHHFLGNSTYAFSAMLTTYLTGLAAGSWVGGRLADRTPSPTRALGLIQLGVAVAAAATVPLIWNWLPGLDPAIINPQNWDAYLLRRFLLSFAVMALPTFLSGMTFPLVNRIGIQNLDRIGGKVGHFYFANTAGSIVGSLAAGFLVLPWLGTRNALLATSLLSAMVGLTILLKNTRRQRRDPWPGFAVVILLAILFVPLARLAKPLLSDTQDATDVVLFDQEDPTAETRVYRKPNGDLHMSVDGHHIGGTRISIVRKEKILAHLPLALVPHAGHTLSVGLGSGVTLGTLALYDEIEKMTCVEIVPGVIKGAQLFAPYHGDVMHDPRLKMVLGDGIQHLLTTTDTYDVISSDSKLNPEYAGNSALLSLDYYELCRSHLNEHGIMVQWLAQHYPTAETQTVIRSFGLAFEHMELFWVDPGNLILVGSPQPIVFDFDRFAALVTEPDVRQDLESQNLADPYIVISHRVAGKAKLQAGLADVRPNTWQRPILEFSVLRHTREHPVSDLEDENFRFLARIWQRDGLAVRGAHDPERRQRFGASCRQFMLGYGSGGGTNYVANGREALRAGLRDNPDDFRLTRLLAMIDQDLSRSVASGQEGDTESLVRQAKSQIDTGNPQRALEILDRALTAAPDHTELQFTRVKALRRLGRQEEALALCQDHLKEAPDDAPWLSQASIILSQLGRLDESLVAARRVVELVPDSAVYLNNLATTLGRMKEFAEAADLFARVHELDPLTKGAAFYAAAAYSMAGSTSQSAHWVDICLQLDLVKSEEFRTNSMFSNLRESAAWRDAWNQ